MFNLTNKYGLPDALYRAIKNDPYTFTGQYSVTQLIQPPQIRQLSRRHADKIEEDVTDRLWTLLGSAVHKVLERSEDKHAEDLQEVRIEKDFNGTIVSGQADLWESPDKLYDYKFTSVWAGIGELKKDWIYQLNMLAHLYRYAGIPVNHLYILAIFRDWSKNRAKQGGDYPEVGAKVIPIPAMKDGDIEQLFLERIAIHEKAAKLKDENLPECSSEERWERPTQFALMKNKNKRALKLFDSVFLAVETKEELERSCPKDTFYLETRIGESIRCESYCPAKNFCHQYKRMKEE
jgi:hypothetical protein